MNNARRKAITELANKVRPLIDQLDELKSEIEAIRDEEQEYFDNMPESLQGGERGQAAEQAIEQLDEAYNALDELVGADVAEKLDEATA